MGSNLMYGYDKQKIFKPKYMAKNIRSSQRQKRHDENNVGGQGLLAAKDK